MRADRRRILRWPNDMLISIDSLHGIRKRPIHRKCPAAAVEEVLVRIF